MAISSQCYSVDLFTFLLVLAMPTQKQLDEAKRIWASLDHKALSNMSDEEILIRYSSDPDACFPTEEELEKFDLILPPKARRERKHAA
jgi:hypothetical protein